MDFRNGNMISLRRSSGSGPESPLSEPLVVEEKVQRYSYKNGPTVETKQVVVHWVHEEVRLSLSEGFRYEILLRGYRRRKDGSEGEIQGRKTFTSVVEAPEVLQPLLKGPERLLDEAMAQVSDAMDKFRRSLK